MQVELIDSKAAHIANTICNASRECFDEKQFMEFCKERLDEDSIRSAVETNQVVDKDVHGLAIARRRECLEVIAKARGEDA